MLPSHTEQGEIMQWIGTYTYTDIHEQKLALARLNEAQQEVRHNNEQLTRANLDLDNFIYTALHDLKAPITNIEGLPGALQHELREVPAAETGEVPVMLAMMQDSVERFKRTIDLLTDVTKLQKARNEPVAPVSLVALIAEVELDPAPLIQPSGAQVRIEVGDCPQVSFSEKNLRSVVYNLLSNALKYRSPEVSLRCRPEPGCAVLSVHDNGPGLNLAGEQDRLFGMFQRLHDHVEDSGIGLYRVKKIIENAAGRVKFTSKLDEGSPFTVYFKQ